MSKRPFLAMGLFAFAAALFADRASLLAITVVGVLAVFTVLSAVVLRKSRIAKPMAFAAVGVALVCSSFLVKYITVVYPQAAYDGSDVKVTVRVIEKVSGNLYLTEVVSGDLQEGVRISVPLFNDNIAPRLGDLFVGNMTLEKNLNSYARSRDVYLYATDTAVTWCDGSDSLEKTTEWLYSWRSYIHDLWYRYMDFDSAAVCDAITIGNRVNLSKDAVYTYRVSGIYHMLVVSGMHLSVLSGVLLWFLKRICRLRPRAAAVLTMAGVVLFSALCGFSTSVSRSTVMMLIMLLSTMFRRRAEGLNSLGLSAVLILTVDPFAICDLGFLLTFASTFGILMVLPAWDRMITERLAKRWHTASALLRPLSSAVGVTLSATLFVQPILTLYFGTFSPYFLVGNLLCSAVSTALMVLCMLGVVCSLICPAVVTPLMMLCKYGCHWLSGCAAIITDWPMSTLPSDLPFVAAWQWVLPLVLIVMYRHQKEMGVVLSLTAMVMLLIGGMGVHHLLTMDEMMIKPVDTDNTAVIVKTVQTAGLLVEGDGQVLEACTDALQSEGIDRLDWVVWLNRGAVQSVDVSALGVSIEQLLVVDDIGNYAALPVAEQVTELQHGDRVTFAKDSTLQWFDGWFELSYGDTTVMIADEYSDAALLSDEQCGADLLILSQYLPYNDARLNAEQTVVFCETVSRSYWRERFSHPFDFVSADMAFLTTGNGEIVLRSY